MNMKKKMILLVSLLLLAAAVLGGMPQDAWADTQSKEYVVDDAGLFTDKEKEQLTKMCRKASDACKTDVVILTQSKGLDDKELENDVRGIINESYGYDESSSEPDAIVYVIDMKSRADMLVTSGIARTTKSFTQSKLDAIREKAEDKLSDGNYYAGCKKYIAGVRKQLDTSLSYRLSLYLPQKLLISLGVAAAVVIAMMFQAKSKMTVDTAERIPGIITSTSEDVKTVLSIQRLLHVILNPAAVREVPAAVAAEETPAAQADIFNLNRYFVKY